MFIIILAHNSFFFYNYYTNNVINNYWKSHKTGSNHVWIENPLNLLIFLISVSHYHILMLNDGYNYIKKKKNSYIMFVRVDNERCGNHIKIVI